MYFVYIIKCKDGSLYTGITTNVDRRFVEHSEGRGARYTRAKGVVKVVYIKKCKDRSKASIHEASIKKLSRIQKIALVKKTARE